MLKGRWSDDIFDDDAEEGLDPGPARGPAQEDEFVAAIEDWGCFVVQGLAGLQKGDVDERLMGFPVAGVVASFELVVEVELVVD